VRFAIDRAGLVGADGATHAGSFDIGFMTNLPGMVVMAAADEAELKHMTVTAAAYEDGPIAFRYPRGEGVGVELPEQGEVLEIGKGRMIQDGSRVALLSFGTRLEEVHKAAEALAATNHRGRSFCQALGSRIDIVASFLTRGNHHHRRGRCGWIRLTCGTNAG